MGGKNRKIETWSAFICCKKNLNIEAERSTYRFLFLVKLLKGYGSSRFFHKIALDGIDFFTILIITDVDKHQK